MNLDKSNNSKVILLRSSWQSCNIGDISHTLGIVQLIHKHLDNIHIILWPGYMEDKEKKLLYDYLPDLEILDKTNYSQIDEAIDRADLFIHGSGSGLGGQKAIEYWISRTNKPFGIFGVSITDTSSDIINILNKAAFIFTRETDSLKLLQQAGCTCTISQFTPDAVFGMDICNKKASQNILKKYELETNGFICVIPRLRYTPYHLIRNKEDLSAEWTDEKIQYITKVNNQHKFEDAKCLHEPIISWVRQTSKKVLVCPEMTYQLDIMNQLVIDPLPEDVKSHVKSMKEYWMPDAAQGVYEKASCVVSMECHSPIMAWNVHSPAIYLRQPEDTIKGQMYYDLNLTQWVYEIENTNPAEVAERTMSVLTSPNDIKKRSNHVSKKCEQLHKKSMDVIENLL